ncbi:MAG: hypothetical protein ACOX6D_06680 [Thermoguttaceae bacterium]|jgi:Ca2+/Na+ antiporter
MKEIRNFRGEIVRVESEYGEKWWHLSASTWGFLLGLGFLLLGFFMPTSVLVAVLRVFDVRIWTWEHFVLFSVIAGYLFVCWGLYRNWSEYDEDEERHAKNFILFGATVVVILLFLLILSIVGRFHLFFRPVVDLFARGRVTLAALWRTALIVVSVVPLIHFGKEWILGFWDD